MPKPWVIPLENRNDYSYCEALELCPLMILSPGGKQLIVPHYGLPKTRHNLPVTKYTKKNHNTTPIIWSVDYSTDKATDKEPQKFRTNNASVQNHSQELIASEARAPLQIQRI